MLNITRKRMISYDTDIQNTPEKAHNSDLIKIGISQGDTNGVGYELILKHSLTLECLNYARQSFWPC